MVDERGGSAGRVRPGLPCLSLVPAPSLSLAPVPAPFRVPSLSSRAAPCLSLFGPEALPHSEERNVVVAVAARRAGADVVVVAVARGGGGGGDGGAGCGGRPLEAGDSSTRWGGASLGPPVQLTFRGSTRALPTNNTVMNTPCTLMLTAVRLGT